MRKLLRAANERYLLRYRAEYLVFLVLMMAMRSMSPELCWRMARKLGRICFRMGLRRKTMISNLQIAFPHMSEEERIEVAGKCWEHFVCMMVDTVFQRRMLRRSSLFEKIQISGWAKDFIDEHGIEALPEQTRRCIFCGGHFGNWELATGMFKLMGVTISPVFRTPSNPFLAKLVRSIRLDGDVEFIERRGAVASMVDILDNGGNVGFLFDQEALSGVMVPLFGVEAPTHKTPAVLHHDLKVPIFFGSMIRRGDFLQYEARGALLHDLTETDDRTADIRAILTALNKRLEERIREHPEQYFWMHRRWKRLGIHGEKYRKDKPQ